MTRRARDEARVTRQKARKSRDAKILLALAMGFSVREVAEAFGLSPARVCQIRAVKT